MAKVNQEFQSAPAGVRIIAPLFVMVAVVTVAFVTNLVFVSKKVSWNTHPTVQILGAFAPLLALLVGGVIYLIERSRISRFRIEENVLVFGRKRYPLENLVEAVRDPKVLCWAFRKFGNGGLGSIRGRFWSRRLGSFEAFLTDTRDAVILRWPDRVVAVSPADPEFFIHRAREAAGLR
jgi:Bacterial PH domain